MENKLFKNTTSALLVVVMVMSIFAIPAFTGSSEVSAATGASISNCKVSVPTTLTLHKPFTVTMTGDRQDVTTGSVGDTRLVPYMIDFDGDHLGFEYVSFNSQPYSAKITLDRASYYTITAKFKNEKLTNTGRWSFDGYKEIVIYRDLSPVIKFNANKGKVSGKRTMTKRYRNYTKMSAFPTPKRKGFKFIGWYKSKKGYKSDKANKTGYVKDLLFSDKQSMTLYAHWSKNIKVTLNPNGGKLAKKKRVVKRTYKSFRSYYATGSKSTYGKLPQLKKKGNRYFKGWFTKKKGGKRVYTSDIITKSKNHTLYAQWY